MIVLALVGDGRPLPCGVTVLAHVRATGAVTGRHLVDGTAARSDDGSMLLTLLEVADELRVSPRTVERYVKSGKLPSIVLGTARRIDRDDLVAFVAEHRHAGNGSTTRTDDAKSAAPGGPPPAPPALGPRGPAADVLYTFPETANALE